MSSERLLKELTIEALPARHKMLAGKIGLAALIALSRAIGGTQQYIPMPHELLRVLKQQRFRAEFDGGNVQALAIKYGVSQSTVRLVLADRISKTKRAQIEGQIDMFN